MIDTKSCYKRLVCSEDHCIYNGFKKYVLNQMFLSSVNTFYLIAVDN